MAELRAFAEALARDAGAIVRQAFGGGGEVRHKGAIDLVTVTDTASERFLIDRIRARFADHDIVGEETGASQGKGEHRWVLDPLDGTVNFAHGIPHFAVLVAFESNRGGRFETELAVTYDPMRDELFVAERGHGAALSGQPIAVSKTTRLLDAVLATGFAYNRLFTLDDNHKELCRLSLLSQGIRRMGSAGLDLAYVAAGRFDGYWESHLNLWDCAGGALLVREAGGVVAAYDGGEPDLASGALIAANSFLAAPLVEALASARGLPANSRVGLEKLLPAELRNKIATEE